MKAIYIILFLLVLLWNLNQTMNFESLYINKCWENNKFKQYEEKKIKLKKGYMKLCIIYITLQYHALLWLLHQTLLFGEQMVNNLRLYIFHRKQLNFRKRIYEDYLHYFILCSNIVISVSHSHLLQFLQHYMLRKYKNLRI